MIEGRKTDNSTLVCSHLQSVGGLVLPGSNTTGRQDILYASEKKGCTQAPMKLLSADPSFTPSLTHIFSGSYEIFALESIRLVFVYDHTTTMMYYLALRPSEYTILLRLVRAPVGEIIPFEELLPAHSRKKIALAAPYPGLQRHMNRLRKKLPPIWRVVCTPGAGYQLQVIIPSQALQSNPSSTSSLQAS